MTGNSIPRHNPQRIVNIYPYKACTWKFIATSFIIAKKWTRHMCPATYDGWVNKLWYSHTMEYYSAIKRNEVPIHNMDDSWKHYAKWRKPDIKGHIFVWFHLYEMSGIGKAKDPERLMVGRDQEEGGIWEWLLNVSNSFRSDKNSLRLDNGDSCIALWIYQNPLMWWLRW